ncbi:MAG: hypothetical protein KGI91_13965 [Burkholderiales bacterium]|nr:hypothetical protein [Burkholderiales bacterium]MDE2078154.1 hypothetical protein [Burkholderiales bacterium]MDE2432100.1 hypothetical protein [Burkholderiales bacterium]HET8695632.1 hypothetical protein [Aquabacterium sp.]
MILQYLDFEYSEDTEGVGTWDAMASVAPHQVVAVQAEVAQVLGWAYHAFPDGRDALENGGEWDYDLQAQIELSTPEVWQFDPGMGLILTSRQPAGEPRHTVSLSLTGTESFCQALRERFALD